MCEDSVPAKDGPGLFVIFYFYFPRGAPDDHVQRLSIVRRVLTIIYVRMWMAIRVLPTNTRTHRVV